jgi:hypothetical protein
MISQFVCNESANISAFVICGGGWGYWRCQYSECLSYRPLHTGMRGCVASLLSLNEPEGLISSWFTREVPARPAIDYSGWHTYTILSLGGVLYFICRSSLLVYRNYQILTKLAGVSKALAHTVTSHFLAESLY